MIVSLGYSHLVLPEMLSFLKKSQAPCPLQGGHTVLALRGMCMVGVQVLARSETGKEAKSRFLESFSFPISTAVRLGS